jgi:pimeloyl-ACP methyl ester carboxylesterase
MVFYDARSHGRSVRAPAETATIDQLGRDLDRVLADLAPRGPVVLVGHSMGGMTIMALADQHPEYFGPRVIGVALLSTSTGRLADVTLGLPAITARLRAPVLPLALRLMRSRAQLIERSRRIGSDIAWLLTRRYSFGSTDVSPALVEYVGQMIAATPVEVVAEFFPALNAHDKLSALGTLAGIETFIAVGDKDLLTPVEHSRLMAEALPRAELLVLEGVGHLAMMERPALVTLRVRAFLHRAARSAGGPATRGAR